MRYNSSNSTEDVNSSSDSYLVDLARIWLQGILLSVIGSLGFVGNIGAVIYFANGKKYKRTFEALMLWLAVWDNIFITCAFMLYAVPEYLFYRRIYNSEYSAYTIPWLVPIAQLASTCNVLFTMSISIERYYVICKPLLHRARGTKSSAPYVLLIISFALIYNLSKFFELETMELNEDMEGKFGIDMPYNVV